MKHANPPKFFVVSMVIFLVMFVQLKTESNRVPIRQESLTSAKGHAALIKPKQVMNTPTAIATVTATNMAVQSAVIVPQAPTATKTQLPASPFQRFTKMVIDGKAGIVRGVYVEGVLALRVVQQPGNDWKFVSTDDGTVTQFQSATSNGVTGLLAHNYLSGQLFYKISLGKEIDIVFGDGGVRRYQVSSILKFQKLDLNSLTSDFIDLRNGKLTTTADVFSQVYSGGDRVTLQTCLEKDGISNWGLIFVVAKPLINVN